MIKYFSLFFLLSVFFHVNAVAEQTASKWVKPTPVFNQKFDWLKLTSDEWLKGSIITMYDDELEFDSDKFGQISFDWEDVSELRSRYDKQIRLADGRVVQGFLIVKDGHLSIISGGTEQHFPLDDLLSITSAADSRRNLWTFNIGAGLNLYRGNTNQLDYTTTASTQRSTPYSRFKIDFIASYSKAENVSAESITIESRRLTSSLDWFYTTKIFFRVLDYESFSDSQQNIKYRNTLGVSIGYHIINNKRLLWDTTLGPSYQKTTYTSEIATDSEDSAAAAFSTSIEYKISSKIDYTLDYQLQFVSEESGKRNHHFQTGFEFDFTHNFDIDLTFYLDRVEKPLITTDEITPEKNDYRLVLSVKYKY